jgi:hypothetical protein
MRERATFPISLKLSKLAIIKAKLRRRLPIRDIAGSLL